MKWGFICCIWSKNQWYSDLKKKIQDFHPIAWLKESRGHHTYVTTICLCPVLDLIPCNSLHFKTYRFVLSLKLLNTAQEKCKILFKTVFLLVSLKQPQSAREYLFPNSHPRFSQCFTNVSLNNDLFMRLDIFFIKGEACYRTRLDRFSSF